MKRNYLGFILIGLLCLVGCSSDDNGGGGGSPTPGSAEFTVTVENLFLLKNYFSSDTTAAIPPTAPDNTLTYTFNAGQGHYFNFAMMFVESNDLFFAPDEGGIPLYTIEQDGSWTALTGDITSMIDLWDAGTEINEAPALGPNQPFRQEAPDTGDDELGTVQRLSDIDDTFTYPAVEELIKVTLEHDGGTLFTVTIENLSANTAIPTPFSPGVRLIHFADQTPLFVEGMEASEGLERLAEDGDIMTLKDDLEANSGLFSPFSPGAYIVGDNNTIFTVGEEASDALEALAEDGDPSGFDNIFNIPDGTNSPNVILEGQSYSFTFTATDGQKLSWATMFVQSNDWFIGGDNIDLFDNGTAVSGDITSLMTLYDAGTEVDEYAGAGHDQAPRQAGPNTGDDEGDVVAEEDAPSSNVPIDISEYIKITITSK